MSKTPIRTLTVCEGRDTIGYIDEMGGRQFVALSAATGKTLGVYSSSGEAAQAIDAERRAQGGAA